MTFTKTLVATTLFAFSASISAPAVAMAWFTKENVKPEAVKPSIDIYSAEVELQYQEGKRLRKELTYLRHDVETNKFSSYSEGQSKLLEKMNQVLAKWLPLAEKGHPQAQLDIAWLYNDSNISLYDVNKAIYWFQKYAESGGGGLVEWWLALLYEKKQDYEQAVKWYQKWADKGNHQGASALARMYYEGKGVKQSDEQALKWYERAQELDKKGLGYVDESLALYVARGSATDLEKAVSLYQKACVEDKSDMRKYRNETCDKYQYLVE